ncbi:MAG: hypothetical protein PHG55_13555 [Verrucomicrobiota bacterium]|nr:hypothetical protein [Verrucomicrobiota bacterium]
MNGAFSSRLFLSAWLEAGAGELPAAGAERTMAYRTGIDPDPDFDFDFDFSEFLQ